MNPDGTVITMDDTTPCNTKPCQKGEIHIFYSVQAAQNSLLLQLCQRKNCHFACMLHRPFKNLFYQVRISYCKIAALNLQTFDLLTFWLTFS